MIYHLLFKLRVSYVILKFEERSSTIRWGVHWLMLKTEGDYQQAIYSTDFYDGEDNDEDSADYQHERKKVYYEAELRVSINYCFHSPKQF